MGSLSRGGVRRGSFFTTAPPVPPRRDGITGISRIEDKWRAEKTFFLFFHPCYPCYPWLNLWFFRCLSRRHGQATAHGVIRRGSIDANHTQVADTPNFIIPNSNFILSLILLPPLRLRVRKSPSSPVFLVEFFCL